MVVRTQTAFSSHMGLLLAALRRALATWLQGRALPVNRLPGCWDTPFDNPWALESRDCDLLIYDVAKF